MKSKNILLTQIFPKPNDYGAFDNENLYSGTHRSQSFTMPHAYDPGSVYDYFVTKNGTSKSYLAKLYKALSFSSPPSGPLYGFLNGSTEGPILDKLMGSFIIPRMSKTIVCSIDDWDDPNNDVEHEDDHCALFYSMEVCDRFSKMLHWLHENGEERIKLINLMESNLTNLLDKVETINVRRDNNTPQNATTPDADSHLSFYSKNVNSTDLTTLMARIKEIKDNIYDEYEEWAIAFEQKFAILCL